jgi:3-oxoacyl-[acyl-carrier protein] reductase
VGSGPFDGQGFLVIGGAEGIGRAVVLLAAARGARVLFSAGSCSQALAADLLAAAGHEGGAVRDRPQPGRVSYLLTDLSTESEVDRLFDLASDLLPELRVLVVNLVGHGALFQGKSLLETSLEEWSQGLSAGLRIPFLVTQRAVQEFVVGGEGGRVVYILATPPAGGIPAFAGMTAAHVSMEAAQSALASFTRSIAKEYGRRRIVCNAVLLRGDGTSGPVDAAAETVLFLASEEASFVNGEVLEVTR